MLHDTLFSISKDFMTTRWLPVLQIALSQFLCFVQSAMNDPAKSKLYVCQFCSKVHGKHHLFHHKKVAIARRDKNWEIVSLN